MLTFPAIAIATVASIAAAASIATASYVADEKSYF